MNVIYNKKFVYDGSKNSPHNIAYAINMIEKNFSKTFYISLSVSKGWEIEFLSE